MLRTKRNILYINLKNILCVQCRLKGFYTSSINYPNFPFDLHSNFKQNELINVSFVI